MYRFFVKCFLFESSCSLLLFIFLLLHLLDLFFVVCWVTHPGLTALSWDPWRCHTAAVGHNVLQRQKRGQMSWSLALPEEKLKPWKPTCLSHMILSLCCYSGRLWNFGRRRVYIELIHKALVSFWEEQHVSVGSSTWTIMKCISQAAAQAVADFSLCESWAERLCVWCLPEGMSGRKQLLPEAGTLTILGS